MACKETRKYGPFTRKKRLIGPVPEEAKTLDLLDKDLKSTLLNMLKKLKEIMDNQIKEPRE